MKIATYGLRISVCLGAIVGAGMGALAQMTTSQVDNARTGAYLAEPTLTPQNVNRQQFGKQFTLKVDGDVYAQPLLLAGVEIPGKGKHDVLFVATEHDTVYAFDAYGSPSAPLWKVSLAKDGTPVPGGDTACFFIQPEVGITSTPVIDTKTGTLYVLARTKIGHSFSANEYHQQLHALAVTTGAEKFGGPAEITATVPGKGAGSKNGSLAFEPLRENPRAALLLANGSVFLTWGSSCDVGPYHGWLIAYDAQTLKQKAVFNASPDADDSGFWASDTGIAADKGGNVFAATGNGRFDAGNGGRDYGDTLLKLSLSGNELKLADYFTPYDADELDKSDDDLGSGGPMLLPDQPGPHPHLAVIGGKFPRIYVLDRDRLGHFQAETDHDALQVLQTTGGIYGSMAYWNRHVYVVADSDYLRDYEVKDGKLEFKAESGFWLKDHAATPAVSANGAKDGIVWVVSSKGWNSPPRTAVLHAVDAANVRHELYSSEQNAERDRAGIGLRFNIPTVVNGHVYIGARHEVDVYGLLPAGH